MLPQVWQKDGLAIMNARNMLVVIIIFTLLAIRAYAGSDWIDRYLDFSRKSTNIEQLPVLQLVRQDFEHLQINRSVIGSPIIIGSKRFAHGLGTHSVSRILVYSPDPIVSFTAEVGVDKNERTAGGNGSVVFSVAAGNNEIYRSPIKRGGEEPSIISLALEGINIIALEVSDGGDGPACDHADWADAVIKTKGGKMLRLDEIKQGVVPGFVPDYPFSFVYDGKESSKLLEQWKYEEIVEKLGMDRSKSINIWTDSSTGLRVTYEVLRYNDFPAVDWVLYFENIGTHDTPVIQDVNALDVALQPPVFGQSPFILHKTKGAPADPTDYEVTESFVSLGHSELLGGGGGRSSNKDLPFFKIESGGSSVIVAIGWSGQWLAEISSPSQNMLRIKAGLEKTHFILHPGEKVRSPRIVILHWQGDTLECNAQFRQLVYKHYCAERNGKKPLPTLFCNTCFTRGGGWLNECNAENQISLINAYAPLGLEALITDAGWFEGGWPAGAGNWNPRKDAYPNGMGPVAKAAADKGMVYGLWFEPERVVAGTELDRKHSDWVLHFPNDGGTGLLNFGLPEARDYFFGIVKGFMDLPGFRFYRQDFNMDPLPYWRANDAENRQGITEMKYIAGLYEYWDRIAAAWPDSFREECASGGRRIDIETIKRMHIHQDSDYWFDNDVDQAQIWGLSQYLPNNVFTTPINRLDDYSFHSTMATSLCLGWIADASDFDLARAKKLTDRYRSIRELLIGAWYPLLPYTRDPRQWMAMQWHRPDLDAGFLLVFRHRESPYRSIEVSLHGLKPDKDYELICDSTGEIISKSGAELMKGFTITLSERGSSDLVEYRAVK